ncbi:hypothetical protein HDF24_18435 [Mucilaginibacter sp. X4EP1]|uniref:hypothetical protein n=1 Tax=Mucilaginibacter sp. X4EP1 TaxID=2723092 RepID=UPI002169E7BA|nr:hypothetical protein [Mucilaginibacter sp. X4EP1]MCS3813452.1 hypothetical protein [Mucilaginibacter sp. X4EP1]
MKKILTLLLAIISLNLNAQEIEHYFQQIRNNPAKLAAFFAQMPKGGDLHHHYSGSVYAESYIKWVIEKNYFINKKTLQVAVKIPDNDIMWKSFSELRNSGKLDSIKFVLIQKWSIKDYNQVSYPSDRLFFEAFGNFDIASQLNVDSGLLEIKARAKAEHVSYIETILSPISNPINKIKTGADFDAKLEQLQLIQDSTETQKLLFKSYDQLKNQDMVQAANQFCTSTSRLHNSLGVDDSLFTMRYQTSVLRFETPMNFFTSLILAFEAANRSSLIVGVNIIAPENNEVSMRDYWLQMQMFRFCHKIYPKVKYSMHAGELCLGMVKPEDLTWHISSAIYDAGAMRIGHGLDIPYENHSYNLLKYMHKKHIPVEINLSSNEFILKIKGANHPITLYKQFGVPILICTDDAGVLRTNLTEQYVLVATRYPEFSYNDIKTIVYNSIYYSFIKEASVRKKLTADLDRDYRCFEKEVLSDR